MMREWEEGYKSDRCAECGLLPPNHTARCGSSGMDDDAVYGYAVYASFRQGSEFSTKVFRSKGSSETKARRVPILKRGFESIQRLEPLSRKEWLSMFGEGRM